MDALGLTGPPIFAKQSKAGPPVSFLQADLAALSFLMKVLMTQVGLWSLSVEEVFYLAFPVLCRAVRSPALLAGFWLLVIAVGPAWCMAHQDEGTSFTPTSPASVASP